EDAPERNNQDEFDWKKAQLIVPPRTSVWAYIDNRTGDLLISASDSVYQADACIRINAEDIVGFIDSLTDLIGWPSAGAPREPSQPPVHPPPAADVPTKPKAPTGANRAGKYRAKKQTVTPSPVTVGARTVTHRDGHDTATAVKGES